MDGLGGTLETIWTISKYTPNALATRYAWRLAQGLYAGDVRGELQRDECLTQVGTVGRETYEFFRDSSRRTPRENVEHLTGRGLEVVKTVAYVLAQLGREALSDPHTAGRIVGNVLYEVAEGMATAGVAKLGLPAKMAKILDRVAGGLKANKLIGPETATHLATVARSLEMLSGPKCFVAGTPLLTPEGPRPIEASRPGDLILSRPEGEPYSTPAAKVVEAVFERAGFTLLLGVSGRVIETTAEHPFHVVGRGWRVAAKLEPGDVLASHNETLGVVEEVTETGGVRAVYNLRVADWHTYFVGGDDWGFSVWAHNAYEVRHIGNGVYKIWNTETSTFAKSSV